jgi:hypothetical protein
MQTTRRSYRQSLIAAGLVGVLALGGATACSDEDGDGATTDEEVGELDDAGEDVGDELQQEVEEGQNEAE